MNEKEMKRIRLRKLNIARTSEQLRKRLASHYRNIFPVAYARVYKMFEINLINSQLTIYFQCFQRKFYGKFEKL